MKKVLVIAPHADDETLGCGGSMLKHLQSGDKVYWLIVTKMADDLGFSFEQIDRRKKEIDLVSKAYGLTGTFELDFPPAGLDMLSKGDIIGGLGKIINEVAPEIVYTPYRNDAHSDHEIVYDATMAATKTFRYPFIERVLAYETISETDFGLKPEDGGFRPNVYVDISNHIEKKIEILEIFESEMGDFPFPRSRKAIESLAFVRGAQCNRNAAEAFMLIKEIA
jgi:LmbE family N-acetylglucosaminyl deacetylase